MRHARYGWRALACQVIALSMIAVGLVVVAAPPAHAVADAVVSGTVVDSLTKQPLADVTVADSTSGRSTTTAVAGTYSLSVPPGDHVLTATLAGYVPSSTPTLTLASGQVLATQGFTLDKYASASGVVTETGTTTGIAAVVVKFFDAATESPNPLFAATSGPDGSWSTSQLAPGSYKVQFDASQTQFASTWFGGADRTGAKPVLLSAAGTQDLSVPLARTSTPSTTKVVAQSVTAQGTASFSGRVTVEPGGTAAAGAYVTAYPAVPASVSPSATADADGRYTLAGLAQGYYVIGAETWGQNSIRGYLGGTVSRLLGSLVWISDGAALTGQDIHLQRPGTISGTIVQQGLPVASAQASLVGMGLRLDSVLTQSDGAFQITNVPPGTYRLSATDRIGVTWAVSAPDIGAADEITVLPDSHLAGYVMTLPARYTLSGTVRDQAGVPSTGVSVALMVEGTKWTVRVDAQGFYSIHNLPAGTYELGLDHGMGIVDWSPGSSVPDYVTVSSDSMKDLTDYPRKTITLNVAGSDGSVPASFSVWAFNEHDEFANSGIPVNGNVDVNLQPGAYRIDLSAPGYRPWSTHIDVTAPMTIPVTLDVGGRIAGNLAGARARVRAINTTTGESADIPDSGGTFSFAGLSSGEYVLTAAPLGTSGLDCGPATWFGGSSYLTAQRFHVDSGTVLSGKDLTSSCEAGWAPLGDVLGDVALPPTSPPGSLAGVVLYATSSMGSLSTVPATDGSFDLTDLQPGTYVISAFQSALGLEGRASVTVTGGTTQIVTVTLTRRGRVSGQVVGPHGEAVHATVSNGETEVQTDTAGVFALGGISYGVHTLLVVPTQAPYASTRASVTVGPGADVTGLVIRAPLSGALEGRLRSTAGSIEVTVFDASDEMLASAFFQEFFSFSQLPPGAVKVRFSGSKVITQWWRGAASFASATSILIAEGGGVTDITPNLISGTGETTSITGKVTFAGSALAGVDVRTAVGTRTVTTKSGGDGTFLLSVPLGDTYRITASTCLGSPGYGCNGQAFTDARDVVADSVTVSGVDFVVPLPPDSFAFGSQPVITGHPAMGETLTATVGAWDPTPDSTTWQWYADGLGIYNATGTTLTLTDRELGKQIQVVVTQAKAGYATVTLPSAPTDPVDVPGAVHALTPSRLLDSRIGQGFQGPANNGTVITIPVLGTAGVPQDASAVLMNLTVTDPTASGYVVAYASGGPVPWASSANFAKGTTAANLSLVPVGADGAIALRATVPGSVQVIADIQGYVVGGPVSAAGAVVPVTPARVIDTRTTQRVAAKGTINVPVAGVANVPDDATAVVANVTVTEAKGPGYLTAWPTGVTMPTASNVNFVTNQTVPNLAIVKIGANRSISLYSNASAPIDVIVDIQGYVRAGTPTLPGTVLPVTPTRVVDTRLGLNANGPVWGTSGVVVDLDSPDLAAIPQGALINLTVTEPKSTGYLSAYPYGMPTPLVSNLNFGPGMDVPNLSLATLNSGMAVLYNGSPGSVQIVADVLAYVL